ncbi:MAG: deoxyguanosinetriphosphate triphosphohydrolase [Chloroflexi bacterium]|jgi:dGTPase|nr:deoxyguanosinetriphosphate triphosphohydrolase [Chloroflexota bacterium]MBT7082384.1 deoxyguanosinetriphosphate triphosphohydrolase [Chloroflexota bacterium]MBT7290624.1 deoxyguanosinetriphosphate triphosphohydrolase [Chloroflexota bacterium]
MIHNEVRQRLEEDENGLSPHAAKSRTSRGRQRKEEPSEMRLEFQRDRDRIIHCNSFRRLKYKTQVFIAPIDDHYVTRLTHTIEVAQISRSIARALNLNEDLTEAIALGHDLGHTPFGHVGEEELNRLYPEGFRHNEQSLRVVETLENGGRGLNLTWEVRDGILKHSKSGMDLFDAGWDFPETLEAQICKIADPVAYINHDLNDALRAGLVSQKDLPKPALSTLGRSHSQRINTLVCDIIDNSWAATGLSGGNGVPVIVMSQKVLDAANVLRNFLFKNVYRVCASEIETRKARETINKLYHYYSANPDRMPDDFRNTKDDVLRKVVDYIAGMTDQYAFRIADQIGG